MSVALVVIAVLACVMTVWSKQIYSWTLLWSRPTDLHAVDVVPDIDICRCPVRGV